MYKACLESTEGWRGLRIEKKSLLCGKYTLFIQQYFLEPHNAFYVRFTAYALHGNRNYVSNYTLL